MPKREKRKRREKEKKEKKKRGKPPATDRPQQVRVADPVLPPCWAAPQHTNGDPQLMSPPSRPTISPALSVPNPAATLPQPEELSSPPKQQIGQQRLNLSRS